MKLSPVKKGPTVFSRLSPAIPTIAYDTFWKFAAERQRIFFCRLENRPRPWTEDPILAQYKFTNAYRASDRVSQYLIRNVIESPCDDPADFIFRVLLFKLFNKIETWELLRAEVGEPSWRRYKYRDYSNVLGRAFGAGTRIYSAAYIMASGTQIYGVSRKHEGHLLLLEQMLKSKLPGRLAACKTMKDAFECLRSYPLIGDFLAYQLVTDINYGTLTNFSEMEFTMPGPGARDGIRKCFSDLGGLSESEIVRVMADRQEVEFERLGLRFKDLWGRRLQLIDIQNLFCEVDKYSRIKHPELSGVSGRTRIKQSFRECNSPIEYVYPKKWGLRVKQPERPAFELRGD
jgi:hypothetical protein